MDVAVTLTVDQKAFLEECLLEFSDRFTDSDLEYKQVYDAEIPPPPIMSPWYGRPKMNNFRNRGHGSRYGERNQRDNRYDNNRDNYRDREHGGDNYRDREHRGDQDHYREDKGNRRFRPY